MNEKIEKLEEIVDMQQLHPNCLLLHGIMENEDEHTDDLVLKTVNEKMNIEPSSSDLHRTHCVGQKKESNRKPRVANVKFASYNSRKQVGT